MGDIDFTIRKFDMSAVPKIAICVFNGKRNTGKSFLVRDYLYHHSDFPATVLISPTEKKAPFFSKFMPVCFMWDAYDSTIIDNIILRQEKMINKVAMGKRLDPSCCLILDDCMYDTKFSKDLGMKYVFCNGRHDKMNAIITMQYPLGIPPMLRSNIDYVFILRENNIKNRKILHDNYGGCVDFPMFCKIMDSCTENRKCLVVNNCCNSGDPSEIFFWYKAQLHDNFRLGTNHTWRYWKKRHQEAMQRKSELEKGKNVPPIVQNVQLGKGKKGAAIVVKCEGDEPPPDVAKPDKRKRADKANKADKADKTDKTDRTDKTERTKKKTDTERRSEKKRSTSTTVAPGG